MTKLQPHQLLPGQHRTIRRRVMHFGHRRCPSAFWDAVRRAEVSAAAYRRRRRLDPCDEFRMAKALARAHRWQRLLESGECASITELAAAEKIDRSYLCRVLRLTLLTPEIVEAIMEGQQGDAMTLPRLMKGSPVKWERQFQIERSSVAELERRAARLPL